MTCLKDFCVKAHDSGNSLTKPCGAFATADDFFGFESFVAPEVAAKFVKVTTRRLKEMARAGAVPAHPVDPDSLKKEWRFLLSELAEWMRQNSRKRG